MKTHVGLARHLLQSRDFIYDHSPLIIIKIIMRLQYACNAKRDAKNKQFGCFSIVKHLLQLLSSRKSEGLLFQSCTDTIRILCIKA